MTREQYAPPPEQTPTSRRGVYPGSFNPLTNAHLAIADAAHDQLDLDAVDLVVSEVALDKRDAPGPPLSERVRLIETDISDRPWLSVRTTPFQLIADIADGYDVVVMGADKWVQVNALRYYADETERDASLARLPITAVAARTGSDLPQYGDIVRLDIAAVHASTSSTNARNGTLDLLPPAARCWWEQHLQTDNPTTPI